jgi:hypothetical protein
MRKRFLLLLAFTISFLSLKAQDYKVLSMESLPLDMTARENIKQDERGRQCAVLRISTQNIAPEQRLGFHFECDYASFAVERQIVEGEIWVWVSPGLKTLKIKHAQLGNVELHTVNFGITVEALRTYKIILQGTINSNNEVVQQYLAFQIAPTDAELEVDGEIWPLSSRGTARRRVNEGMYHYKVTALDYEDVESTVAVADSAVVVSVMLKPISKKPTKQQPAAQTVQPKIEQPTSQKTVGSAFFVMANAAYSLAPQASFGFTMGRVKRFGWFVSVMSNFGFKAMRYDFIADTEGYVDGVYPAYSGESCSTRISVMGGALVKVAEPLYLRAGVGYGMRIKSWYMGDGKLVKIPDDSWMGVEACLGAQLHLKGFVLSLDAVTTSFKDVEAKVGLGFSF